MQKDTTILLARNLVDLFYPLVEMTLFDHKGKVLEILNAFSALKEDQSIDLKNHPATPFSELLSIGRSVKSLVFPLQKTGYLRLRYDITCFKNVQEQLNLIFKTEISNEMPTDPWKEAINQVIDHYCTENKLTVQAMTAKQKRDLISKLQNKGLLDFKESSAYVAARLGVSRATVYNYLKTASDLRKVHIHQVDAFTDKKFGGNPAGVVLDADLLDEQTMRKIARELNLSETAFVQKSKKSDFQMRYFTPTGHEIAFCGHSTVGALFMIAKELRYGITPSSRSSTFEVETLAGVIKMEAAINDREEIVVGFETPQIKLKPSKISYQNLAEAAGFSVHAIDQSYPIMYEETNRDLYAVISSLKELKKIECNPKSLAQFSKQHDIVAICLLTPEAFDKKNQFHMRCFAPLVGIPEDPFTGSVLGGLAAYVDTFGLLKKGASEFRAEQGHIMGRPGTVRVEFEKQGNKYHAKVFAQAVHCFSTEINL